MDGSVILSAIFDILLGAVILISMAIATLSMLLMMGACSLSPLQPIQVVPRKSLYAYQAVRVSDGFKTNKEK